jgi:hypothetical protein
MYESITYIARREKLIRKKIDIDFELGSIIEIKERECCLKRNHDLGREDVGYVVCLIF